jgi:hypothetical protein
MRCLFCYSAYLAIKRGIKQLNCYFYDSLAVIVSSRARSQEPGARSQEPGAKSQEPRTRNQEPRTKNQEPRTMNYEPGTLIVANENPESK